MCATVVVAVAVAVAVGGFVSLIVYDSHLLYIKDIVIKRVSREEGGTYH